MRINPFLVLLVYLLLIDIGCTKPDRKTEIFSNYLQREFKKKIPNKVHYFVLIPKVVCKGCADVSLNELNQFINEENSEKFTFISTNDDIIPEELKQKINLQHDKSGTLDVLNLDIANITLVETSNEKVNFIKSYNIDEAATITKMIK